MIRLPTFSLATYLLAVAIALSASFAFGQLEFDNEPINYESATPTEKVQQLKERLERGDLTLAYDKQHGFLKAVLAELEIPKSSQLLVFSKTSSQIRKISPHRPRAVYFNDDIYVGWVQHGGVVELSSADPMLGAVFFTIDQEQTSQPKIIRDRGQCLICHASSRTQGVPGHLMRSVYVGRSGQPEFGSGTFNTNDTSPLAERWGGWYVTGTHGGQRHMGNVLITDPVDNENLDTEAGANLVDLDELVDTSPYLTPHSDIVALMVLGHQTHVHNLITRANFETRSALHYDQIMNKALDRDKDYRSESTTRRIEAAAEKLVAGLLFSGEVKLTDTVEGTSGFAEEFAARGPFDRKRRSLREFDLETRLMKYPCSFLIYSQAFDALPREGKQVVYEKLLAVLSGQDTREEYHHLSAADRRAILEILLATKKDLPESWREKL